MQVGLAADKVDADERLAAVPLVAMGTLAAGVCSCYNTLRSVEAFVVVAWAGARKYHGGRELAK